uniref:Calponin-homology (CH) domain-containing protein n=1 Tax=Periophthalmus magnuspinnatus TaxID=409849 RepID=A0A3B4BB57_9GOBI
MWSYTCSDTAQDYSKATVFRKGSFLSCECDFYSNDTCSNEYLVSILVLYVVCAFCRLLSSVKPGLVKKINRLLTPIAGLDNLTAFLRGCEDLGLKGSQLFDPGDLQDTSTAQTNNRKLKNVLITLYWLGRAANCCTSYNGPTLDLAQFEGLLSQMRKVGSYHVHNHKETMFLHASNTTQKGNLLSKSLYSFILCINQCMYAIIYLHK